MSVGGWSPAELAEENDRRLVHGDVPLLLDLGPAAGGARGAQPLYKPHSPLGESCHPQGGRQAERAALDSTSREGHGASPLHAAGPRR